MRFFKGTFHHRHTGRTADGALLADEQGIVVFWTKAAERLLGFRADDALGRPYQQVMQGETLAGDPICSLSCAVRHRLGCGNGVHNFDIQTHTKSGKVIWLNVSSLPVPSRKPRQFLFAHLFRDSTKRMRILSLAEERNALLATSGGHSLADTTRRRSIGSPPSVVPDIPPTLLPGEREREVLRLLAGGEPPRGGQDSRLREVLLGGMKEWHQSALVELCSVEMGGAKQLWFFILELEMLAAASAGQRFSVALWGSFIRSPAPFCDSRKRSHLRHSFSCHRSQAESIAPFPSQCFGGAALPLLHQWVS